MIFALKLTAVVVSIGANVYVTVAGRRIERMSARLRAEAARRRDG